MDFYSQRHICHLPFAYYQKTLVSYLYLKKIKYYLQMSIHLCTSVTDILFTLLLAKYLTKAQIIFLGT